MRGFPCFSNMVMCKYNHDNYTMIIALMRTIMVWHAILCYDMIYYNIALDSLRGSSVNIGTTQRRLARPLHKDDTHESRSVSICSAACVMVCFIACMIVTMKWHMLIVLSMYICYTMHVLLHIIVLCCILPSLEVVDKLKDSFLDCTEDGGCWDMLRQLIVL